MCFSVFQNEKLSTQEETDEKCREKNLTGFTELPEKTFEIIYILNQILPLRNKKIIYEEKFIMGMLIFFKLKIFTIK